MTSLRKNAQAPISHLFFDPRSGTVICRECEPADAFRSLPSIRAHLKEKHGHEGPVGCNFVNGMLRKAGLASGQAMNSASGRERIIPPDEKVPKCLDGSYLSDEQKLYWYAPTSLRGKTQALPAVPFLTVRDGLQCPAQGCLYCCVSMDAMKTHYNEHKGAGKNVAPMPKPANVRVQSLNRLGSKRKFFPVYEETRYEGSETFQDAVNKNRRDGETLSIRTGVAHRSNVATIAGDMVQGLAEQEQGVEFSELEDLFVLPNVVGTQNQNLVRRPVPETGARKNRSRRVTFATPLESSSIAPTQNEADPTASGAPLSAAERHREALCLRSKAVGDMIWDAVKNVNPAFKGATVRRVFDGKDSATAGHDAAEIFHTIGDDQLLGNGAESERKSTEMFETLCNFRQLLSFLGYESLRDVPVELASLPARSKVFVHSSTNSSHSNREAQIPANAAETDDDSDDSDIEDENNKSSASKPFSIPLSSLSNQRTEDSSAETVDLGSTLLQEFGFDESFVVAIITEYLIQCRVTTFNCSEHARRIVYTRERLVTNGEKHGGGRIVHDPRERFRASMKDSTLRSYAVEVAKLVLFCLRLTMIKLKYNNSLLNELFDEDSGEWDQLGDRNKDVVSRGNIQKLRDMLKKHKQSLLSRAAIKDRYGKLLSIVSNDITRSSLSFILQNFSPSKQTFTSSGGESYEQESMRPLMRSLHRLLCALLMQTLNGTASTNELLVRHFSAIMSVWHIKPRWRKPDPMTLPPPEEIARSAVVTSFEPESEARLKDTDDTALDDRHSPTACKTSLPSKTHSNVSEDTSEMIPSTNLEESANGQYDCELFRIKRAWEMSTLFAGLIYTSSSSGIWEMFFGASDTCNMSEEEVRAAFSSERNNSVCLLRGFLSKAIHVLKNTDGGLRFMKCCRPGPEHAHCAWVDTVECSLQMLRKAIISWQSKLRKVIHEDLLFGMQLPAGFWEQVAKLQDHFRMDTRGFNVFSRKVHEEFAVKAARLISEHIASDSDLFYQFFHSTSSNGSTASQEADISGYSIRHDSSSVDRYLDRCREARNLALTLAHVTGGSPARGTELASFLLENTAEAVRNFYVFHGQVVLCAEYNKTRSLSATSRTIARFLDMESSRLWLLLVSVIRPFEVALVGAKYGSEAAQTQARHLFTDRGNPYKATNIRNVIAKHLRVEGIDFKFSQYRHWQCGIIRISSSEKEHPVLLQGWGKHLGYSYTLANAKEDNNGAMHSDRNEGQTGSNFQEVGAQMTQRSSHPWPDSSNVMDEQAGHTPATADRIYAQSSDSFRGVPASRMSAFQDASKNWHALLQIESDWKIPDCSSQLLGLHGSLQGEFGVSRSSSLSLFPFDGGSSAIQRKRPLNEALQELNVNAPTQGPSKRNCSETVPEALHLATGRIRQLDYALTSLEHTTKSRILGSMGAPLAPDIPMQCRREMLEALRAVLRRPKAVFSCNVQEEAIFGALKRQRDMIVIMGTGTGKSAIFQTIAHLEAIAALGENRSPPVTIVVVPLVALVVDHLRECSRISGLHSGGWGDRYKADIQLLFISVEHACSTEFSRLIVKLANNKRLGRIIIDECQYAVLWCSFRPTFLRLGSSLHHPSIRFQRVLLSATIPPDKVEETARMLGLVNGYQVLRQSSTVRKNLSYRVHTADTKRFQSKEDSVVERVCTEVSDELIRIAKSVAASREAYTHRNVCTVEVKKPENVRFQVSKQQIMIYAPFKQFVDQTCKSLEKRNIHRKELHETYQMTREKPAEPDSHVWLAVCDVMSYYASLDSRIKDRNHARWMMSPENLYKAQSPAARRRFEDLVLETSRAETGKTFYQETETTTGPTVCVVLVQIMVGTCAFGTGINSRPVRAVIHGGCSRSIIEYAQESGRAGRDGLPARCVVVFDARFVEKIARQITQDLPDIVRELNNQGGTVSQSQSAVSSVPLQNSGLEIRKAEQAFAQHVVWLQSAQQCRRTSLSQFLDDFPGPACIHDAQVMETSACDVCRVLGHSEENIPSCQPANSMGVRVPLGATEVLVQGLSSKITFSSPRRGSSCQREESNMGAKGTTTEDLDSRNKELREGTCFQGRSRETTRVVHPSPAKQYEQEENIFGIIRKASDIENDPRAETLAVVEKKEEFKRSHNLLEDFKEEMDRVFLDKCLFCLSTKGVSHKVKPQDASSCANKAGACYRCFRKNCSLNACQVFPRVALNRSRSNHAQAASSTLRLQEPKKTKVPTPCKDCGLLYFHGKYIHTWGRFGPNCPFRGALQICLGAWYLAPSRRIIIEKFNLSEDWNTNQDRHAREYADWLRRMDDQDEQYNFMKVFTAMTAPVDGEEI